MAALVLTTIAGCGSNSTPVGVVVAPSTLTVKYSGQQQFGATVTGSASSTVTWQICLPPNTAGTQPVTCNPTIPGLGQTLLGSGYGTITSGQGGIGGGLYTAPAGAPPTNPFFVVAVSTQDLNAFGTATVNITSGITVTVEPTTAAMATGETYQFNANVQGTPNNGVTWSVTGSTGGPVVGGNSTIGFVCPSSGITVPCTPGEYFSPAISPGSVTVTATSAADSSKSGSASVTITSSALSVVTAIQPNLVSEGSVYQEIYITGTNLLSTSSVMVGSNTAAAVAVPTIFVSPTLLRAKIPAGPLSSAGALKIYVQSQNGDISNILPGSQGLTVNPTRPAIVTALPNTITPVLSATNINLNGGFFSSNSAVQVNGQPVASTVTSSQQLLVPLAANSLPIPGSYPVMVRNTDVEAPAPALASVNIAVEPAQSTIPAAPTGSISVGVAPQAIAIDPSLGLAVVANSGDNTVSIINLTTKANVVAPLGVGNTPTSVAIDDQLPHHIAVVVNSKDNTLSTIDLTSLSVVGSAYPLPNPNAPSLNPPIPFAVGINPATHQAIVANQTANFAWIVDYSTGVPNPTQQPEQIGGTLTPFSTGLNPTIAVDEGLNWAVVTPGGLGNVNVVELGRKAGTGGNTQDLGRPASVVAVLTASTSIQGVGINQQTHTALLADPTGPASTFNPSPALSSFSLMNQSISSTTFTQNNTPFDQIGLTASAVNSLANIGIAVNSSANNGYVVDLANDAVLQTFAGLNNPVAVAVDQATNTAYVVNQGNNTVSVVSMGNSFNPLQITATNPSFTLVQPTPAPVTLTVTGIGFTGASKVYLDDTAITPTLINSRSLSAAVPVSLLTGPRRFSVYVENGAGTTPSNVSYLDVIQPINVGINPVGVAVDSYLDQAVVTNAASNSISVIDLLTSLPVPINNPSAFSTGTTPVGVAILERKALAVVTNNGSNDVTILDEKGVNATFQPPAEVALCGIGCTFPTGVAVDSDQARAQVVETYCPTPTPGCETNIGGISSLAVDLSSTGSAVQGIDFIPVAVAVDPDETMVGIAVAGQTSEFQLLPAGPYCSKQTVNNLQLPTGVVWDPVNQDFLVSNSTVNSITIIPACSNVVQGSIATGINPTSVDYNWNTSSLVTSNASTNTISVLNYVCPPNPNGVTSCPTPAVRSVVAAGTPPPSSSVVVGPNSIAIDRRLNIAVQVDQINNRILVVPLPQ
jgi:DNA-binding beta-propeller fold protein YncE